MILHVAPEAAAGGPLAFVRTGDMITVDVENRILSMDVSDDELQARSQTPGERGGICGARPAGGRSCTSTT